MKEIAVKFRVLNSTVQLTIRDNCRGVEQPAAQWQPGLIGMGPGGMRERARELGGEVRLKDGNPGTVVEVVVPLSSEMFVAAGG